MHDSFKKEKSNVVFKILRGPNEDCLSLQMIKSGLHLCWHMYLNLLVYYEDPI